MLTAIRSNTGGGNNDDPPPDDVAAAEAAGAVATMAAKTGDRVAATATATMAMKTIEDPRQVVQIESCVTDRG